MSDDHARAPAPAPAAAPAPTSNAFECIDGVPIPKPLRCRTITMLDVVTAAKAHSASKQCEVPTQVTISSDYLKTWLIVPIESRRRIALSRHGDVARANAEARILRDALNAMDLDALLQYRFDLSDGWMDFLLPFIEAHTSGMSDK